MLRFARTLKAREDAAERGRSDVGRSRGLELWRMAYTVINRDIGGIFRTVRARTRARGRPAGSPA